MNITLPSNKSDGTLFSAVDYNDVLDALRAYQVALADLATPYGHFVLTLCTDSLASGGTHTYRVVVPAGQTWYTVQAETSYQSGTTPTVTLQFTDDGTNVLTTAASAASAGGTPTAQTAVNVSSHAAGSLLVFTLTGSGGATATNVTGVVHFKCKLTE